jgi:hypothetical protein
VGKFGHWFCLLTAAVNLTLLVSLVAGLLTSDGFHKAHVREPIHPMFVILSVSWLLATCVATIWPLVVAERAKGGAQ